MKQRVQPGDRMVYQKTKYSPSPGPRAKAVAPTEHGEGYSYLVDKLWIVSEVLPDGRLKLRTRRGKEHIVRADDPNLRPARLWERWVYRRRFQDAEQASPDSPTPKASRDEVPAR